VETFLRGVGFGVWLFVGAFTLRASPHAASLAEWVWWIGFGGFGVSFAWATSRASLLSRRLALCVESACAVTLCAAGMREFEGALAAVVAAQIPALVPLPLAAAWIGVQSVPLLLDVAGTHGPWRTARATSEYLVFGGFSLAVAHLRQRETRARIEVGRLNGELIATQRLLADNARVAERSRISRDLHDALGHHLVSLGLQLERQRERTGGLSEPVAEAKRIAESMLTEVRSVVSALRDESGVDVGRALEALAAAWSQPRVHLELSASLERVEPERAHVLFRCVQEALSNAVRHGCAQNVWVRIERSGEAFRLHLRDDGKGAREITLGNGLRGMRERLTSLGGQLDVSSSPGRGFELRASIPIAQGAQ
jgi:signal transduction histidine kinase